MLEWFWSRKEAQSILRSSFKKRWRLLPSFKNQLVFIAFLPSDSVIKILIQAERNFHSICSLLQGIHPHISHHPEWWSKNGGEKEEKVKNIQVTCNIFHCSCSTFCDEWWRIDLTEHYSAQGSLWIWFWLCSTPTAFRPLGISIIQADEARIKHM